MPPVEATQMSSDIDEATRALQSDACGVDRSLAVSYNAYYEVSETRWWTS